jgi:hypothetical protein
LQEDRPASFLRKTLGKGYLDNFSEAVRRCFAKNHKEKYIFWKFGPRIAESKRDFGYLEYLQKQNHTCNFLIIARPCGISL